MRSSSILAFAILMTTAVPSLAQRAPDLATLDRGDGITRLGLDMGLTLLDSPPYSAVLRLEPYGQYVTHSGLGLYGAFPITRSFGGADGPPAPQDTFAIGNLELGLLYVIEPSRTVSWVFRGGVALPTGSDGPDERLTNYLGVYPRFTDLALSIPSAWYGRVSVSPLIHAHRLFFRADLGLDVGSHDAGFADELLRFNLGLGYDFGALALALELVNTYSFEDFDGGDNAEHTAALTLRFMGRGVQPFLAVGTPLDEGPREMVHLFIAGGIQAVFH